MKRELGRGDGGGGGGGGVGAQWLDCAVRWLEEASLYCLRLLQMCNQHLRNMLFSS